MTEAEIVAKVLPSIKTLGSFGGLISAGVLIWDRATRHAPYARFLRLDESNVPEENRVILRIYNPSDRLMLARIVASKDAGDLYLSPDDETFARSGIEGIMAVKPDGHVDVNAERHDDWKTLSRDTPVRAVFEWKSAQPSIRRGWRTKRIVMVKQDFDAISPRSW